MPGLVKCCFYNKKLESGRGSFSQNFLSIVKPSKTICYCGEGLSLFKAGDTLKWLFSKILEVGISVRGTDREKWLRAGALA